MNTLDVLKYGNQTVQQALAGLPDEAWQTSGVCGVWSVKDIIAHLTSYESVLRDLLKSFVDGGPPPQSLRKLRDNDAEVALRKEKTAQQVLDEYNEAHAQVMELAAQIPAETLRQTGTIPWYGMEYAVDDFVVYAYYGHKREHCAQIAVYRDTL
jgi:uncharacterized damage-inducible protein DinB